MTPVAATLAVPRPARGPSPLDVRTANTIEGMRASLRGQRRGLAAFVPFVGPALMASVAYIDPGNYATNIEAGARYGYALLWVVLLANAVAMLFQSLAARLGIVTGMGLAEVCREHWPRPLVHAMWIVGEVAAMATDVAEFLGGALGLSLLLHIPMLPAMLVMMGLTFLLLYWDRHGFRRTEWIVGALVGVVCVGYLVQLFLARLDWHAAAHGLVTPVLGDRHALMLAVGIVGATVMPHALYLHAGLAGFRLGWLPSPNRARLLRYSHWEVLGALGLAGLVNLAMTATAASTMHATHGEAVGLEYAYRTLVPLLGGAAASLFLVSLVASGVSSSVVGTMAGQMIMQGFVRFRVPMWVRRVLTMLPSLVVAWLGVDITRALVMSQVVLSIALPIPMVALVWFTSQTRTMGEYAVPTVVALLAALAALAVIGLNGWLVVAALGA